MLQTLHQYIRVRDKSPPSREKKCYEQKKTSPENRTISDNKSILQSETQRNPSARELGGWALAQYSLVPISRSERSKGESQRADLTTVCGLERGLAKGLR